MRATPESYFGIGETTQPRQEIQLENGYIEVIPLWIPWIVGISIVGAFAVALFAIYKK